MTNEQRVFTLSDRAIVLYFALRELGPLTAPEMCIRLNKSPASIYRCMRELRKAGFLPPSRFDDIPKDKPKPSNARPYALTTKLVNA